MNLRCFSFFLETSQAGAPQILWNPLLSRLNPQFLELFVLKSCSMHLFRGQSLSNPHLNVQCLRISIAKFHPNVLLRSIGCHPGRQCDDLQQCHRRMRLEPSVGTAATLAAGAADFSEFSVEFGGFLKWRYPNSWMVLILANPIKMDDLWV